MGLGDCCTRLLELYESEAYKASFDFVDHVRPLRTTESVTTLLDQRVLDLLFQRADVRLAVAHPEPPSSDVETCKIWCGHIKKDDVEDLDLDVVFDFLDEYRAKRHEETGHSQGLDPGS